MRGSTPCSCDANRRYGGNTSCVAIEAPGADPILLDLGTGLRFFGLTQPRDGSFRGTALVSHLHWDHIQGIPFFAPMLAPGARLDVYAPGQPGRPIEDVVRDVIRPPWFPVELDALPGEFKFHEASTELVEIDGFTVRSAAVPHCGPTTGYRIERDGISVAYVCDHQQPGVGSTKVADEVLELCEGVDLLIHDAQFDDDEFALRHDWGHCTIDYAVEVAAQAGARRLALFHHDPSHDDDRIDSLLAHARGVATPRGIDEVIAAYEGLTLSFEGTTSR